MLKTFEGFTRYDNDIEFGDVVIYNGMNKLHKRGEKAIILGIEYNEGNGFNYFLIEFANGDKKRCKSPLLIKRSKKTYDDIAFLKMMKKRKSYLDREKDGSDEFLFAKEKENNEQIRREKKRIAKEKKKEEMRIKMKDIDPYFEEDWGEDEDDEKPTPPWLSGDWRVRR
jgi:hypothetical protein